MSNKLVTLKTFRFLPEAEAHRIFLESEGVRAFLADVEIVNMDWLLGNAVGNIKLQVPESEAARAIELLAQMPGEPHDFSEDDGESDESHCLACGETMTDEQTICPSCGWTFDNAGDAEASEE